MAFWQVWLLGSSWLKMLSSALISLPACNRQAIQGWTAAHNYQYPLLDFLAGVHCSSEYWKQSWARGRSSSSKCRSYEYTSWGHFEPWSNETVLLACILVLSTHTEMLHPVGGLLRVNLGSPCGSLSSSLLQTWLLIKAPTGSVNSAGRGMSAFPTFTPQSRREMGDLALALSTATALENYRRCFQLCCLHSSSDKWAGFLPRSQCCHFFWTTPHVGSPCVTVCF